MKSIIRYARAGALITGLLALGGCSFNLGATQQPSVSPKQEKQTTEQAPMAAKKEVIPAQPVVAQPKNCGSNLGCLAEASKTCAEATATSQYTLDLFGVNYAFNDSYQIKGMKNGACTFYLKTNTVSVTYGAEQKKALLDTGKTEADIAGYEKAGTDDARKSFAGKDATCTFTQNTALTSLITNWQKGDRVSATVATAGTCIGPLMNAEIGGGGATN